MPKQHLQPLLQHLLAFIIIGLSERVVRSPLEFMPSALVLSGWYKEVLFSLFSFCVQFWECWRVGMPAPNAGTATAFGASVQMLSAHCTMLYTSASLWKEGMRWLEREGTHFLGSRSECSPGIRLCFGIQWFKTVLTTSLLETIHTISYCI